MLNRPRRTAPWYRYVLGAGAAVALTAVGAAAMWTGWLPSRPIQWNDINGRLNLGNTGAAIESQRPIVVNNWPSAGALGYQAKSNGAFGASAVKGDEAAKHGDKDKDHDRGFAQWGAGRKAKLTGTAGKSGFGAGGLGHGGGLGTPSGGSIAHNTPASTAPKSSKSASSGAPKASGTHSGSGGGGGAITSAPAPALAENTTTVGDLATGAIGGIGTGLDLGFGPGTSAGGGSSMAATPEPASIMLIGTGALALAGMLRRRRQ
jgi:hypothetical protein